VNGIATAFGVPIGHYHIDNFDNLSKILNSFDLENCTKRVGEKYLSDWDCNVKTGLDIERNNSEYGWVPEFINHIEKYIYEYISSISLYDLPIETLMPPPWVNIYEFNDFQEIHEHLGSQNLISYCYFHKLPERHGKFVLVDKNANNFYLGQENTQLLKTVGGNFVPQVKEGDLIIFPSWVSHKVTLNKSTDQRISISGNVKVRTSGEFNK
jgi:uncharacterized protein (TIGR02466 family)